MTYTLTFGKHRGKSFEWLLFHDPGYVWWLEEKFHDEPGIFPPMIRRHFKTIVRRASHLQVPGTCAACSQAAITQMVLVSRPDGRLGEVRFCCLDCAPAPSAGVLVGRPGFRTPDLFHEYDKAGGKRLIAAIKTAFFGDASQRMTDAGLHAFFATESHFAAP